jgi:protoheme IX farnesyltransferase
MINSSALADYIALTKPRIILLLLVTALGGMFLASNGVPLISLAALVLVGGTLGAGGANALNHYLDRDIDELMKRTRGRPVPGRRVKPVRALIFGIFLNILAFVILYFWVNLLAACLTLSATLFYVLVYTRWLKRSTTQNIVIGGAAGAVPPMVGWVAVTGSLDLPALYMFAIVFFWTPPHFWALSLLIKDDYAQAAVPMLPVVRGVPETTRSIMLHTIILVAITILFFTIQVLGWIYLVTAIVLGLGFLFFAWRLLAVGGIRVTRQLYLYSLLYLALIFAAIMVDSVLVS